MKFIQYPMIVMFSVIWLFIIFGCTESPLGEYDISAVNRQIRGKVILSDKSNPEGIYVWLEAFDIGSFTDGNGRYQVTLPITISQGPLAELNGVFDLYFYIANYKISSAKVVVQNGEFFYTRGDFDAEGEMTGTRSLLKLLHIVTLVDPDSVMTDFEGQLNVHVTLQAMFDSVTVILPKIIGGFSGAILLRRLESGDIFVDIPDISDSHQNEEKIGPEERVLHMVFNIDRGALPEGKYEIIPYFLIEQENMPEGFLESLSPNAKEIGPDYLKIPFKREGGYFEVMTRSE